MSNHPKGAITSIEQFQALCKDGMRTVYEASIAHTRNQPNTVDVTGNIIHKHYADHSEPYIGYEKQNFHTASCLDVHLLPQDYNDWYLFQSAEDAQAYIDSDKVAS